MLFSKQVTVTAPTRIDLAGGTLDLLGVNQVIPDATTVNMAVTIPATVKMSISENQQYHIISKDQNLQTSGNYQQIINNLEFPLVRLFLRELWKEEYPGIRIEIHAKSPKGAGLGGSSCLTVCMLAAFVEHRKQLKDPIGVDSDEHFISIAQDLETRLIEVPTGCQDYWPALRGGMNIITFPPGKQKCETLPVISLDYWQKNLLLCFTGESRDSGINNWDVFKKVFDRDQVVIDRLTRISQHAKQVAKALKNRDVSLAIQKSIEEWQERENLWPRITTSRTRELSRAAIDAGAKATRICGAGGGGVMAIYCEEHLRSKVSDKISLMGGMILDGQPTAQGLSVVVEK